MINILSIRCSLAFAPYLSTCAAEFLSDGVVASQVVRQGGRGLILRSDGDLVLRHEHRQASLGRDEARHYSVAIQFRREFYSVSRMQDEIVLATVDGELMLSHPQSEIWLRCEAVAGLVSAFTNASLATQESSTHYPEWLKMSIGGGRMLLSDQRTGRWVLLGADHIREFERRGDSLRHLREPAAAPTAPTISMKGLTVHFQSARKVAETLEEFASTGRFTPFEEITPTYSLKAFGSIQGLEMTDSDGRIALTAREARKWTDIISAELDRLNVAQIERGGIRTVFADHPDGRWALQWGDEVFLPSSMRAGLSASGVILSEATDGPIAKRIGGFLLLLDPKSGACVALTDSELRLLADVDSVA